ncbi:MAG: hypothetical protein LBF27_06840 [Sphingobacterium sp.]|jgi:hypothetical protein|nr:hypothetical protein [Sphingobacterium sp.]
MDTNIHRSIFINGGDDIEITDPKAAVQYGLDPRANCNGLTKTLVHF